MIARVALCLLAVTLCGCGPSAKQKAHDDFRQAVAAMKVCAQGSTYEEFREKRLALETCCAAHTELPTPAFNELSDTMTATDTMWYFSIQHPTRRVEDDTSTGDAAPKLLNKAINAQLKGHAMPHIPDGMDMQAANYVQFGLTLIAIQCDDLLK
jgi:hypothetical protein